jgi:hypothetical protein
MSDLATTAAGDVLVDELVSNLAFGRIRSVAFVVLSDVTWTLPLYDVAIATARRGWRIGLDDVRYWVVTPEVDLVVSLVNHGGFDVTSDRRRFVRSSAWSLQQTRRSSSSMACG